MFSWFYATHTHTQQTHIWQRSGLTIGWNRSFEFTILAFMSYVFFWILPLLSWPWGREVEGEEGLSGRYMSMRMTTAWFSPGGICPHGRYLVSRMNYEA